MSNERKRLRDLGMKIGHYLTGKRNSLTDVPGVKVGHKTLSYILENGQVVRTGVTAILPHDQKMHFQLLHLQMMR